MANLDERERRYQRALYVAASLRRLSDDAIAKGSGLSRQAIWARRTGDTRIRPGDLPSLANALDVPETIFDLEEAEVLRWFADRLATSSWRGTAPDLGFPSAA
jgi:transcriptional regulator with XRE-family HTH domain